MALFREGAIWHTAVLPLGGDHITNDIAVGLRTPVAEAEDLKKRYGCALTARVRWPSFSATTARLASSSTTSLPNGELPTAS